MLDLVSPAANLDQLFQWDGCLGQRSSSAWSQQGCLGPCSPGTNRGINLESHLCCLGHFRTNVFPISRNHPHPSPPALQNGCVSLSQHVAQPGRACTGLQSGITVESLNN